MKKKMPLLFTLGCCLLAGFAQAEEPKLPPALQDLQQDDGNIHTLTLKVDIANSDQDISWQLSPLEQQVFLGRLLRTAAPRHTDDELYAQLPQPNPNYRGLMLTFTTFNGDKLPGLRVFNRQVTDLAGHALRLDPGRELELWLFGTAKILKNQLLATQVIPVFTFNQCLLLGNLIIETTPRQCLLPDNNLLLDVPERPTLAQLRVKNFEDCLEDGKAIIDVFPRRCLAAGGRVFTEPPKLVETPATEGPDKPVNIDDFLREYRGETADF